MSHLVAASAELNEARTISAEELLLPRANGEARQDVVRVLSAKQSQDAARANGSDLGLAVDVKESTSFVLPIAHVAKREPRSLEICIMDASKATRLGNGRYTVLRGEWASKQVVVKLTASGAADRAVLLDQMHVAGILRGHPHVAPVLGMCIATGREESGGAGILTPYYPKGSLYEHLAHTKGRMPSVQVLRWAGQLGSALQSVHASGILHRDFHTGNIMLDNTGENVVLSDFGRATWVDTSSTRQIVEAVVASEENLARQAPEAVGTVGASWSVASDVWAFGLTIITVMRHPSPPLFVEMKARQVREALAGLSDKHLNIPEDYPARLVQLLHSCLHLDVAKRPKLKELLALLLVEDG